LNNWKQRNYEKQNKKKLLAKTTLIELSEMGFISSLKQCKTCTSGAA
jgi:hypothetical protein